MKLTRKHAAMGIPALAALAISLLITSRYGPATNWDSATYVSAAAGLLAGQGYLVFSGYQLVEFPPFYPTVLALIGLSGLPLVEIGRWSSAVAFGLITFISGVWFARHTSHLSLTLLGQACVVFSVPLILVSTYVWSEPLLILLSLLAVVQMEIYLESGRFRHLALCTVLAALATVTRYAGVTVILTGAVLLLSRRNVGFARNLVSAIAFGAIAATLTAAWLARNYILFHSLAPGRGLSSYPLTYNVGRTFAAVAYWFVPFGSAIWHNIREPLLAFLSSTAAGRLAVALLAGGTALVVALVTWLGVRYRAILHQLGAHKLAPAVAFIVIYVAYLVLAASVIRFEAIGTRLLSPIFVPIILLIVWAVDAAQRLLADGRRPRALQLVPMIALAVWLLLPLGAASLTISQAVQEGAGPGTANSRWADSETMSYLREHPIEGAQLYSDRADYVYLLAGQRSKWLPSGKTLAESLSDLAPSSDDVYVAFFGSFDGSVADETQDGRKVELVFAASDDGRIYHITR